MVTLVKWSFQEYSVISIEIYLIQSTQQWLKTFMLTTSLIENFSAHIQLNIIIFWYTL